ncbi:hypothetical protein MVEG_04369 [Podila verticillata NRRL 6337]|nr:hypothetical protein MVEG_04369 [Podila verticillata NRRL 6337]
MMINREKMATLELEQVRVYHQNRIRGMLKSASVHAPGLPIPVKEPRLLVPELMMVVIEYSHPRTWPTLCLLNKDWSSMVLPFIWKTVSNTRPPALPAMKKYARLIRTLDFSCLDTNQFDIFMEIMVNNLEAEFTGVRTLKLANYDITHSDLLSILTRLPSLRALDIKHIKLKDSPSFSLFHLLSNFQQLDSLSLEFSKEDILEASSQDNLRPLSNLVELRLHLTGLAGSVSFLDLSIIPAQLPRLRVLDIKKVFVQEPTLTDLLVSTGHGLRELVLSGVPVHAEAMTRFGPYLNNLHKLDLSRAILRDYNGVIAAIQHCHSLRELTINSFSRKPVWEAVVRSCPELQAFHAVCTLALTRLRVLEFYNLEDHARHSVSSEALHHLGTLTRLERLCLLRCGSWSFEDLRWVLESFPLLDEFEFSRMDVSIPNHGWLVANAGSVRLISSGKSRADLISLG